MSVDTKPNQEFLDFISITKDKKNFPNLEMILKLEKTYPKMFEKVMEEFNAVKANRKGFDEKGKLVRVPWEQALVNFYVSDKYEGITNENVDIAVVFGNRGISQSVFEQASELREEAKSIDAPIHILGKPLAEESILESIERIKNATQLELTEGKETIEGLFNKEFTYEWLAKNDPHNSIIGFFCNCCATINSTYYGKEIVKASVLSPNVQNIVVRNAKGEIIAKGTMYIDKKLGYGVINEFEINERYKKHEIYSTGTYNVEEDSKEEQERDMIFNAFQRGIMAFVEEYDKQNPVHPLKQINVGMGYNKLKRQVQRFKKETQNITVPSRYNFNDTKKEQYILYERAEREIKNGGVDR